MSDIVQLPRDDIGDECRARARAYTVRCGVVPDQFRLDTVLSVIRCENTGFTDAFASGAIRRVLILVALDDDEVVISLKNKVGSIPQARGAAIV